MLTLNELAIHRARLLRGNGEHDESRVAELDRLIVRQHALNLDDAVVKLELAREIAQRLAETPGGMPEGLDEGAELVCLIDDVLHVLRH